VDSAAKVRMNATLAVISGRALLYAVLSLIVVGAVFWALWRLIGLVTMRPLNQILKIVWVLLVVIFVVDWLTGFVGFLPAPLIRL
jgi:hypothetical protein